MKLHDTSTVIVPDFYYETEPVAVDANLKQDSMEKLEIDLDLYKNQINEYLINKKRNIILIVDRLDEFVSKSSLIIQKEMLDALIAVEREYAMISNIELKIFLRDDLFKQLDFDGIGYDKVITKKVELIWSPDKIREFIAKRIYANYISVFGVSNLKVNEDVLNIANNDSNGDYIRLNFFKRTYRKFNSSTNSNLFK